MNATNNLQNEQRHVKGQVRNARNQIAQYESRIAEEQERISNSHDGHHATRLNEIEQAKEQANEAKTTFFSHGANAGALDKSKVEAEQQLTEFKRNLEAKRMQIQEAEDRLRRLERGQGQWLSGYHPSMRNVLQTLENEQHRFKERPIGPAGKYIRLLKPEWSSILEKSFGGFLESFCVTSKEDQALMSSILKRHNS